MMRGTMYVVAILGWMQGFVVNRFVALLRQHGYSMADAFRLASQVSEGAQIAIPFASLAKADAFSRDARQLGARLEIRLPASATG